MAPTDTPQAYQYRPLKNDEIRILHIQPGEMKDTIFIELSHEKLDENISPYHALSWAWGSGPSNNEIRIKDKGSKDQTVFTIKIKENLASALRHLRWRHKIKSLWVDAICINQIEQMDETQNRPQQYWNIAVSKVTDIRKNIPLVQIQREYVFI
jgi:hypothetical protein